MNRNIRPCYSLTNRKQDGGTKGDRHRKHKNPGKWKLSQRGGVATKELKTKCKVQIHENTRDKKLRMRCRWSEAGKGQETDHLNKNLMWWIWKQVQECLFSYSLCQSSSAPPGCVCWQTGSSSKIPAAPPRIRKTNRSHSESTIPGPRWRWRKTTWNVSELWPTSISSSSVIRQLFSFSGFRNFSSRSRVSSWFRHCWVRNMCCTEEERRHGKQRNKTKRDNQDRLVQFKCVLKPAITDFLATETETKLWYGVEVREQFWPRASWRRWVSSLGSSPTWPSQSYKTWRTCRQEAA